MSLGLVGLGLRRHKFRNGRGARKIECIVGRPALTHYSVMGYILEPKELIEKTAPAIAERMHAERVDAAALVPV